MAEDARDLGLDLEQSGERAQEGGLPGAVGAGHGDDLALGHAEVDAGERGAAAEALAEPADVDDRCAHLSASRLSLSVR